jgi:hypothetical protein
LRSYKGQRTTNYLVIETAMAAYAVLEDTQLLVGETLPDDHPYKAVKSLA